MTAKIRRTKQALCCLFVKREGKKARERERERERERGIAAQRNGGASQGCIALQRYTVRRGTACSNSSSNGGAGMGVRGGTGLLSCPTDVSPRESILPPSRITGSPPRARIFASRNPIPRSLARARDTHNFAIMIPETGGLSRAVIDPSRGDARPTFTGPASALPLPLLSHRPLPRDSFCRRGTSAYLFHSR